MAQLKQRLKFNLFGIAINNIRMQTAIKWMRQSYLLKANQIGFFVNVNSFNLAADDKQFQACFKHANRIFADGSGVRLAARHAGFELKDNVNGTDLLPLLCQQMQKDGASLFLFGAEPGVADTMADNLLQQYPGLNIAGTQHGYIAKDKHAELIERINATQADVLLVALGSPIQELWLAEHQAQLNVGASLAVGGLFDFYSGSIPRAPLWLRRLGMEWTYRLYQQPGRLWRRYILGNPLFVFRMIFNYKELVK